MDPSRDGSCNSERPSNSVPEIFRMRSIAFLLPVLFALNTERTLQHPYSFRPFTVRHLLPSDPHGKSNPSAPGLPCMRNGDVCRAQTSNSDDDRYKYCSHFRRHTDGYISATIKTHNAYFGNPLFTSWQKYPQWPPIDSPCTNVFACRD
jgi:hypothetical protein